MIFKLKNQAAVLELKLHFRSPGWGKQGRVSKLIFPLCKDNNTTSDNKGFSLPEQRPR